MKLVQLPNGDWIDPIVVRGVRSILGDSMGPRVLLDVTTAAQVIIIEFDAAEAARVWALEFAEKINADSRRLISN